MSEYDINKIDDTTQQIDAGGTYQAPENKPNYTMAFLAGLGASVLVGIGQPTLFSLQELVSYTASMLHRLEAAAQPSSKGSL